MINILGATKLKLSGDVDGDNELNQKMIHTSSCQNGISATSQRQQWVLSWNFQVKTCNFNFSYFAQVPWLMTML